MKRNFRSFPKESEKVFSILVEEYGFSFKEGTVYTRNKGVWNDTLLLQSSSYGDGTFCLNGGINMSTLHEFWGEKNNDYSLIIASRLTKNGFDDGDLWLPASNKKELEDSLKQFSYYLKKTKSWFEQYDTIEKILSFYFYQRGLKESYLGRYLCADQISVANYGFLLLIAGKITEGLEWVKEAERLMSLPIYWSKDGLILHVREKYSRLEKPSKEDITQLEAVRNIIKKFS